MDWELLLSSQTNLQTVVPEEVLVSARATTVHQAFAHSRPGT